MFRLDAVEWLLPSCTKCVDRNLMVYIMVGLVIAYLSCVGVD